MTYAISNADYGSLENKIGKAITAAYVNSCRHDFLTFIILDRHRPTVAGIFCQSNKFPRSSVKSVAKRIEEK